VRPGGGHRGRGHEGDGRRSGQAAGMEVGAGTWELHMSSELGARLGGAWVAGAVESGRRRRFDYVSVDLVSCSEEF
jgi:hypothetical protein